MFCHKERLLQDLIIYTKGKLHKCLDYKTNKQTSKPLPITEHPVIWRATAAADPALFPLWKFTQEELQDSGWVVVGLGSCFKFIQENFSHISLKFTTSCYLRDCFTKQMQTKIKSQISSDLPDKPMALWYRLLSLLEWGECFSGQSLWPFLVPCVFTWCWGVSWDQSWKYVLHIFVS